MDKEIYKILVIDDHPIVAEGIVTVASQLEGVKCEAVSCMENLEQMADTEKFNLCITDLEMPGTNGFQLIDNLHSKMPECRILVYTMHEEPWVVAKLLDWNISGAVSKNASINELSTAISALKEGNKYFSSAFTELDKETKGSSQHSIHKVLELSKREKEVLAYLSQGLSTPEISDLLFLSVNTIQTYRKRLMEKLEAKNVAELVCKGKGFF